MFLFRTIGPFKATQQFCAERFAIQIPPIAKDFNNNLTQGFLLGWKRGFSKYCAIAVAESATYPFCCMFRSCKIL